MARVIGNPLSFGARMIGGFFGNLGRAAGRIAVRPAAAEMPEVRRIGTEDLGIALRKGVEDFAAVRADVMFLCLFYPIVGVALVTVAFDRSLVPLLFPLVSGFALLGPVAAIGLYEISRRREAGETPGWGAAFAVFSSPAILPLLVLGGYLLAMFLVWLLAADIVHDAFFGDTVPESILGFFTQTLTTPAGWGMIVVGTAVGFLFAAMVLAVSLVSFPLLLDRGVSLPVAVVTSVRAARVNPVPVAAWGLIVAASLVLGALPMFLGLVIVLPVLGHATWHLYRRIVV